MQLLYSLLCSLCREVFGIAVLGFGCLPLDVVDIPSTLIWCDLFDHSGSSILSAEDFRLDVLDSMAQSVYIDSLFLVVIGMVFEVEFE